MDSARRCSPIPQIATHELTPYHEQLVLAARAGSHTAFAELQNMHARRLYNRILSITRNREDAEDALQDTFLRAFRALPSFEGRSRFSSWLTRIATNSALMVIRRRRARPETSFGQPSSMGDGTTQLDVPDTALNPEEACDQQQRSRSILNAIQRLDPKLRTPLSIWISDEASMKAIAHDLGISVASVKARLHRARKNIVQSQSILNHKPKFLPATRGIVSSEASSALQSA